MTKKQELPHFPDIPPSSVKKTRQWVFGNADFSSENQIAMLATKLFEYPEDSFFVFSVEKTALNSLLLAAINTDKIRIVESQNFFYRHPNFDRDYIRIDRHRSRWDWERDVAEKGPMFTRHELRLTEKSRQDMQLARFIDAQKNLNKNPLKLEPNFMGFGVDLRKAYKLLPDVRKWIARLPKRWGM